MPPTPDEEIAALSQIVATLLSARNDWSDSTIDRAIVTASRIRTRITEAVTAARTTGVGRPFVDSSHVGMDAQQRNLPTQEVTLP